MDVILFFAVTPTGHIARKNGDSNFLFGKAWADYLSKARKAGNILIGRKTYDVIIRDKYEFPFKGCLNVIVTHKRMKGDLPHNVVFADGKPKAILSLLRRKGFKSAFICGGSELATSFMEAGLITELYLDFVPLALGKGISIFQGRDFDKRLILVGVKRFPKGVVQLHYRVTR